MRVMRATSVRTSAGADRALGWSGIVVAVSSVLILTVPAGAQEAANVEALSGTLKKVKDTGTITLGYRESSLPFSYLNRRQQPIGYAIDLCREIVEDVSTELDGMQIKIAFAPVTPANRLQKLGRRDRPRMRLDHRQRSAPEGGRVLADLSSSPAPS